MLDRFKEESQREVADTVEDAKRSVREANGDKQRVNEILEETKERVSVTI